MLLAQNAKILQDCSQGAHKYAGIGSLPCFFYCAVMAFYWPVVMHFLLFLTTYNTAIFFGLIWGLLIFNLDRFMVNPPLKRDKFFSSETLIQATTRIYSSASIIAIVIF